jgi:hypothetical protein
VTVARQVVPSQLIAHDEQNILDISHGQNRIFLNFLVCSTNAISVGKRSMLLAP